MPVLILQKREETNVVLSQALLDALGIDSTFTHPSLTLAETLPYSTCPPVTVPQTLPPTTCTSLTVAHTLPSSTCPPVTVPQTLQPTTCTSLTVAQTLPSSTCPPVTVPQTLPPQTLPLYTHPPITMTQTFPQAASTHPPVPNLPSQFLPLTDTPTYQTSTVCEPSSLPPQFYSLWEGSSSLNSQALSMVRMSEVHCELCVQW